MAMNQTTLLPLSNKKIMVTRPAHQAGQLIALLEAKGATVVCQPLIEIVALNDPAAAIEQVQALSQTDIAIFISQNAVTHGVNLIEQYASLPPQLKLATVGAGSAKLLAQRSRRRVDIMPSEQYNSEGLLTQPALQELSNKRIIIFRGIGGRNLLAETLRERGANVSYAEVYQRQCPEIDLAKLQADWQTQAVNIICITSGEGLQNLIANISKKTATAQLRTDILNCQLIIVNKRLSALVEDNAFSKKPIISDNVSDKAIVDAIIKTLD